MIAVDTNILVYAHRGESEFHETAKQCVTELAEGRSAWAIPWPCVHEFWSVATNPRVHKRPTPVPQLVHQIETWMSSPSLVLLHESPRHWAVLRSLIESTKMTGGQIHDARIAALCIQHGVRELWSADRDFKRFTALAVRNPLAG